MQERNELCIFLSLIGIINAAFYFSVLSCSDAFDPDDGEYRSRSNNLKVLFLHHHTRYIMGPGFQLLWRYLIICSSLHAWPHRSCKFNAQHNLFLACDIQYFTLSTYNMDNAQWLLTLSLKFRIVSRYYIKHFLNSQIHTCMYMQCKSIMIPTSFDEFMMNIKAAFFSVFYLIDIFNFTSDW